MNLFEHLDSMLTGGTYVVCDLDNTLIYEDDYLEKAYDSIASYYCNSNEQYLEMLQYLIVEYRKNGRTKLFDKFITHFNLRVSELQMILMLFRTNTNISIDLTSVGKCILSLIGKYKLEYSIVTNGNETQQYNKIRSINFGDFLKPSCVYYANMIDPKPGVKTMNHIKKRHGNNIVYLGDSSIDEEYAFNSDVKFIRVNVFDMQYSGYSKL